MRKALQLAVAVLSLAAVFELRAGTLAGVTLPDTMQAGGSSLLLNGMGLRTKFMVKVYVAGLYLAAKSQDSEAIIKSDGPKRIVLHFVRNVSQKQIADAFSDDFRNNTPDLAWTMKPDIDRLLAAMEAVKEGDEMTFTYLPATGTSFRVHGHDKLTVPGAAFQQMLFSVWLGPNPPNAALKKGLLGG
jgi:Chalcone isomerase-like